MTVATKSGHRVEVLDQRAPGTRVFANANGTLTAEFTASGTSTSTGMWNWNKIRSQYPDDNYWGAQGTVGEVGYEDSTHNREWRLLFQFPLNSVLSGATILSAGAKVNVVSANACANTALNLHRVELNDLSKTTWNNSAGLWANGWMSSAFGCGDANGLWFGSNDTFKNYIQGKVNGGAGTVAFGINSATDGVLKKVAPKDTSLVITYNHAPNAPSGLAVVGASSCGYGTGRAFLGTDQPQFSATLSDRNGDTVGGRLQVVRKSDGAVVYEDPPAGQSPALAVPNGTSRTWPATSALAPGVAYTFRVQTWDGLAASDWSTGCDFEVDTTSPNSPQAVALCSAPCDPELGMPVGAIRDVRFKPGGGDTDVMKYRYGFSVEALSMTAAAGADGTVTVPITMWNTDTTFLYVKAIDKAGRESSQATRVEVTARSSGAAPRARRGDLNGDGLADIGAMTSDNGHQNTVWSWLNTANGAFSPVGVELNNSYASTAIRTLQSDFDGDKLADVAMLRQEPNDRITMWVYRSDGSRYLPPSNAWFDTASAGGWKLDSTNPVAGDFDGDGRSDVGLFFNYGGCRTKLWVFYSTGTTFTGSTDTPVWDSGDNGHCLDRSKPVTGDFDGDGRTEIASFYRTDDACVWKLITFELPGARGAFTLNTGAGQSSSCSDWNQLKPIAGDFDGDGKADVGHFYNYANGRTKLWFLTSNGTGFGAETLRWDSGDNAWDWDKIEASTADVNNDGYDEPVVVYRCCGPNQANVWSFHRASGGSTHAPRLRWDGRITSATGGSKVLETKKYEIVAYHSGKCLTVSGGGTADGTALVQRTCDGTSQQRFTFARLGAAQYQVSPTHTTGKCLDILGSSGDNGGRLGQYTCNGAANQRFSVDYRYDGVTGYLIVSVQARHSGKCWDVYGFSQADDAPVYQWDCWGGANQQWILRPVA
ncbi:RICIN domain-containing protein [Nonomuraea sediminis]|uniref:RICIN domain-containing protein n=1 Tax=Nonomuraea sediminis TaxID=2835864 RepID=UPI001BDCF9B3|nr:RICIN domain-containing protein [Nonomuraea sediminis]